MARGDLDFTIERLGECRIPSPLAGARFTGDSERVLFHQRLEELKPAMACGAEPPAMEAAGMSGRTNLVVSFWSHQFAHVPISLAVSHRRKIDPEGSLWSSVLACTGQPRDMR